MVPGGGLLIGQENLSQQLSPPSVCMVPRGFEYQPSRNTRANTNMLAPQILWSAWMILELHCWGDPDPMSVDRNYGFSTSMDLARQCLVALQACNGGVPRVNIRGSEWVQKTDVMRMGRVLVMNVAIETWITDDPPILMPARTDTTDGVKATVTVDATSPDGSSSIQAEQFDVPR